MKGRYTFISDDSHGWLEVPKQELVALGIAGDISSYSYQKGLLAYLEEDCDATKWMQARDDAGYAFSFNEVYHAGQSNIRNLPRYHHATKTVPTWGDDPVDEVMELLGIK